MNVLGMFDGISCGQLALRRAGVHYDVYYASEVDEYAIKVTQTNFPDTIQLGSVQKARQCSLPKIDLILAGSPCQSISNLGRKEGLKGRSGLFWYFVEAYERAKKDNPSVKFLLENVVGAKEAIRAMSEAINTEPIQINSNLFSAQNRSRLYWTNIDVAGIEPKDIELREILEDGVPKDSILSSGRLKWLMSESGINTVKKRYASIDPKKAQCLTARSDASWNSNYVTRDGVITRLTPVEYERLQTLPDGYTASVPTSKRYSLIGNAWTVDVIAHILKSLATKESTSVQQET